MEPRARNGARELVPAADQAGRLCYSALDQAFISAARSGAPVARRLSRKSDNTGSNNERTGRAIILVVITKTHSQGARCLAFTLVEVMFGVAILSVGFASLYLGFSHGFAIIQVTRENLRATQILQEKMETIRLFSWTQITDAAAQPPYSFSETFYPLATSGSQGITYSGTRIITNAPISERYSNDMMLVIVQLKWASGKIDRQREMRTLVSHYGLQNYIVFGK